MGIDTDYSTGLADGHVLTLAATAGRSTVFEGNQVDAAGSTNSIYMGGYGNKAQAHAVLNIQAQAGGLEALVDPINIYQNNDKLFQMNIGGAGYTGDFHWGGKNVIEAGTGSALNFKSGSRSTLLTGFQVDKQGNLAAGSTLLAQLSANPNQARSLRPIG